MRKRKERQGKSTVRRCLFSALLILVLLISTASAAFFKAETTVTDHSRYALEFYYGDKEYLMSGGYEVKLTYLLEQLGISDEIQSWAVSDPTLFDIFLGDKNGVVYDSTGLVPINEGTVLWLLSLRPFDTTEWLKVVVDGVEHLITVTDDNTTHNVPNDGFYTNTVTTIWDDNSAVTSDTYVNGAPKPTNVRQSTSATSATDFAAGLPLSTIFIDTSKIGFNRDPTVKGTYTLLATDPSIAGGIVLDGTPLVAGVPTVGVTVGYDPTRTVRDDEGELVELIQAKPSEITKLDGDLYCVVFADAAVLPTGARADLKITYSNARIAVDQRLGVINSNYQGEIILSSGASFSYDGKDLRDITTDFTATQRTDMENAVDTTASAYGRSFSNSSSKYFMTGHTLDAKYQVVDKHGYPVDGSFIFAVGGINLDRDPYTNQNMCKPLWYYDSLKFDPYDPDGDGIADDQDGDGIPDYGNDGRDYHFFSESMSINGGMASDYIYVRPNSTVREKSSESTSANYYTQVMVDENGNVRFIGNASSGGVKGYDTAYSTGFVVLADATKGFTVTGVGHGGAYGKNQGMNTNAYSASQIWYRYVSQTGLHGNIQTTSEGNYGGTLDDTKDPRTIKDPDTGVEETVSPKSDILDPGAYVVPEGKTVTYTLTPEPQYQIAKLKMRNSSGNMQEIKFNGKPLYTMQPEQTCQFRNAAGNLCTLTALEDGKFKLDVPYAKHDEEIYVEWSRSIAEVTVKKETHENQSGAFTFKIRAEKTENVTEYNTGTELTDAVGSIWTFDGITYDSDCTSDPAALASDVSQIRLMERIEISGGKYLWKTDKKLSDLGLASLDEDDDLFVDFLNAPSAVVGDTLDSVLNVHLERIYFYHPHTQTEQVTTYWDFAAEEEKTTIPDPEWHTFSLANGGEIAFDIPQRYEYEVYEQVPSGWEQLSIDGVSGASRASGILTEQNGTTPQHTFLNRKLPDLIVKKETPEDTDYYDTFDFTVKFNTAAVDAQNFAVSATATISEGVTSYSFVNSGDAFAVDGITVPAGAFGYGKSTHLDEFCDRLLGLSSAASEQIALGTENGTMSTTAPQSISEWEAAQTEDGEHTVAYSFSSLAKTPQPYVFPLTPAGADYDSDNKQYKFRVTSGSSYVFADLPYGLSYEVHESELLPEDWELVDSDGWEGVLDSDKTATFVNKKNGVFIPENGVRTDSVPYMLVLGFVVVCFAGFAFRIGRKARIDD